MLVLSNEEIARLLTIEECMAALEPMYRDVAEERVLFSPRVDNIAPNSHPEGYYAFKHMGGTWPREKIQALRINSDVVTHPLVAGKPRRVKQPLAPGDRWVGLVLLFSTETGALLAMFPDGVMQRLRVGATSGLGLRHLARPDAARLALIGTGWQAGARRLLLRSLEPAYLYPQLPGAAQPPVRPMDWLQLDMALLRNARSSLSWSLRRCSQYCAGVPRSAGSAALTLAAASRSICS